MKESEVLKSMIGQTIKSAKIVKHSKDCDGENVLVIEMESGKKFYAIGGYGGYTSKSCDEYPEYISVTNKYEFEL